MMKTQWFSVLVIRLMIIFVIWAIIGGPVWQIFAWLAVCYALDFPINWYRARQS